MGSHAAGILFANYFPVSRPLAYALGSLAIAAACVWPRARMLCACGLIACAGAMNLGFQLGAATRAASWAGQHGTAEATLTALERTHWGWRAQLADVVWLGGASERVPSSIRLSGEREVEGVASFGRHRVGDRVRAALRLRAIGGLRNPGRPDPRTAPERAGVGLSARLEHPALHVRIAGGRLAWLHDLRARLAGQLVAAGSGGPLLAALAVGERGQVPQEMRDAFAALGASHLLAVSGLHLGLVAVLSFAALRRGLVALPGWDQARDPRGFALLGASAVALIYALLSGWGVPVRRALVLIFALGVCVARGRATARLAPIWCAALWLLASEPHALFSAGAQLSFLASAALLLAAARAHEGVRLGPLAASATALAVTAPLAALHFGSRAPLALFANAALVPWTASVLLPVTLASSAMLALGLPGDGLATAGAERLAAFTLRTVAWAAEHLPRAASAAPPSLAWIACSAVLGCLAVVARGRGGKICCALAVSLLLAAAPARRLGPEFPRVLFLDVGQGDAALIQSGDDAVLIDAGGRLPGGADLGQLAVVPALRALGVERLSLVVVSHADLDHRGGIPSVLEALPVEALWLPLGGIRDPAFSSLLRVTRRRGVAVSERGAGSAAFLGTELRISPLWPAAGFSGSRNDRSLVVLAEVGGARILFTGDLEAAGEVALLTSGAGLRSDVLKLAHHGSRTSSSQAFLAAVAPHTVVAAAPCQSRFGMPHAEILTRVAAAGASLWWTGRDGAVWLRLGQEIAAWGTGSFAHCPR